MVIATDPPSMEGGSLDMVHLNQAYQWIGSVKIWIRYDYKKHIRILSKSENDKSIYFNSNLNPNSTQRIYVWSEKSDPIHFSFFFVKRPSEKYEKFKMGETTVKNSQSVSKMDQIPMSEFRFDKYRSFDSDYIDFRIEFL